MRKHWLGVGIVLMLAAPTLAQDAARAAAHAADRAWVNVLDYVKGGSGTPGDPWTGESGMAGLGEAIAAQGGGKRYYMPAGCYKATRTILVAESSIAVVGAGIKNTVLVYEQPDGSSCLKVTRGLRKDGGINWVNWITLKDLCIDGRSKASGIAVEMRGCQYVEIDSVRIEKFNQNAATNVGILFGGRNHLTLRNVRMYDCKTCFKIVEDRDATWHSADADNVHISDCSWDCGDKEKGKIIHVENAHLWLLTFGGSNNFSRAHYGFYARLNCQGSVVGQWQFRNIRLEQMSRDESAWAFYIENNGKHVENVVFDNIQTCLLNGIYLKGATAVTVRDCILFSQGKHKAIKAEPSAHPILIQNLVTGSGGVVDIAAGKVFSIHSNYSNGITLAVYDSTVTRPARFEMGQAFVARNLRLTYGPSIDIPAAKANSFLIVVTDAKDFSINTAKTPCEGQLITIVFENGAVKPLGNVSWSDKYYFDSARKKPKMPDNNKFTTVTFRYVKPYRWVEISRAENCYSQ